MIIVARGDADAVSNLRVTQHRLQENADIGCSEKPLAAREGAKHRRRRILLMQPLMLRGSSLSLAADPTKRRMYPASTLCYRITKKTEETGRRMDHTRKRDAPFSHTEETGRGMGGGGRADGLDQGREEINGIEPKETSRTLFGALTKRPNTQLTIFRRVPNVNRELSAHLTFLASHLEIAVREADWTIRPPLVRI